MLNLLLLSLIGGGIICIVTSILGNFMVWKKVSYLGDALGHSSLLGIALGILFNNINIGWTILICIIFSLLLVFLKRVYYFTFESLIVFNVQLFLSIALIILGWVYISDGSTTMSYLFGDLLLLSITDIITILLLDIVIIVYVTLNWNSLLLITINEDLAYSENIKVFLNDSILMSLIAISIAILVKFVGVFLIPSLLIIPALIANYTSKKAIKCFIIAFLTSYIAIILGLILSFIIDISITPLITFIIILEFIIILMVKYVINK